MKKIILVTLIGIMCLGLIGCGKSENNEPGNQEEQKDTNNSELGIGKYKVEKKENSILVITNDGSAVTRTEYKFVSGVVDSAVVTQKYSSASLAKTIFETMKNESAITNQYVDMKLDSDTVSMKIKSEILSVYDGMDLNTVYDLMYETYSAYME